MALVHSFPIRTLAGFSGSTPPPDPVAAFSIVPMYGQSRTSGNSSFPALTTTPLNPGKARMFNHGDGVRLTRFNSTAAWNPASATAFEDLHEQTDMLDLIFGWGETFASSFANYYINHIDSDARLLMFAEGHDGSSLTTLLAVDGAAYNNLLAGVQRAVDLNDTGRPPVVPCIIFAHGDHDRFTTNYEALLKNLRNSFSIDIKAITGQTSEPILITGHVPAYVTTPGQVAPYPMVAKQALHATDPYIFLFGPQYMFELYNDQIHFTNQTTRAVGEYFAVAYQQYLAQGNTKPILPIGAQIDPGNNLMLTVFFSNVGSGLTLDTSNVPGKVASGFQFIQGTSGQSILSVTITGANSVRIESNTPWSTPNSKLRYALNRVNDDGSFTPQHSEARGNLRSANDYFTSLTPGNPTRYNWCCPFELQVTP